MLQNLLNLRKHHSFCLLSSLAPTDLPHACRTEAISGPILGLREMGTNDLLQGPQQGLALCSSYEAAMDALSSLITQRKRGNGSKRNDRFDLMFRYLQALNLEHRIAGLQIIHVAGTKGKGSTCTFSEAILRECGLQTGLFTSPHLMDVRERYRINGSNISRDNFLLHFWECWHQLKEKALEDLPIPSLFQFLTLLAFKIFISEKVDVAILEVGLGGRLDSTNVVKEPVVTGITSLGMDHMEILGDTIEKIAFEKAGIFKPNVPAITVRQCPEAMSVLRDRASILKIPLEVALPLNSNALNGLHLGLAGDHQFTNAGLAVALCSCWLRRTGHLNIFPNENWDANLPEPFLKGLSAAQLSGRAQIVHDVLNHSFEKPRKSSSSGELIFYLDGAHSPESMEVCARWFSSVARDVFHSSTENGHVEETMHQNNAKNENCYSLANKVSKKILLFNCMEVRDPNVLFPQLINTCASHGVHFSKAFFVPSMSSYNRVDSGSSTISTNISHDVSWQSNLQRIWEKIIHVKRGLVRTINVNTFEGAMEVVIHHEVTSKECIIRTSQPKAKEATTSRSDKDKEKVILTAAQWKIKGERVCLNFERHGHVAKYGRVKKDFECGKLSHILHFCRSVERPRPVVALSPPTTDKGKDIVNIQSRVYAITELEAASRDVTIDTTTDSCPKLEKFMRLPSSDLFIGDPSQKCDPANQKYSDSAVIPSLPLAVKFLRDCVRENPTLRLQVLVTGSLHLVGDVLRLLKR